MDYHVQGVDEVLELFVRPASLVQTATSERAGSLWEGTPETLSSAFISHSIINHSGLCIPFFGIT